MSSGVLHVSSMVVLSRAFLHEHFLFFTYLSTQREHSVHTAHLQAPSADKLRHQESLWREDLQSGGNPRRTTPTLSPRCTPMSRSRGATDFERHVRVVWNAVQTQTHTQWDKRQPIVSSFTSSLCSIVVSRSRWLGRSYFRSHGSTMTHLTLCGQVSEDTFATSGKWQRCHTSTNLWRPWSWHLSWFSNQSHRNVTVFVSRHIFAITITAPSRLSCSLGKKLNNKHSSPVKLVKQVSTFTPFMKEIWIKATELLRTLFELTKTSKTPAGRGRTILSNAKRKRWTLKASSKMTDNAGAR